MNTENRGIEWKVGVFLLIGISVIAALAIKFGKLGKGLEKYYIITVEFPNASGLLKGGDVYLAGARVGFVDEAPTLIEGRYAVKVPLRIRQDIRIPERSNIAINSAGFLGDSFVSIDPLPDADPTRSHADGAYVIGTRVKGFGDLTAEGTDVVNELKKRLQELEGPIKSVGNDLLGSQNKQALAESLTNIRELSASLKNTAKNLDDVVLKAKGAANTLQEAMDTAKTAMGRVDGVMTKVDTAAGELKTAIDGITKTTDSATKTMDAARSLIGKANSGQGPLGMLLSDRDTAENLRALIRNLREHGILWYKDKPKR